MTGEDASRLPPLPVRPRPTRRPRGPGTTRDPAGTARSLPRRRGRPPGAIPQRTSIIKALASAEPPERKKIHREPAALDGLHDHIDTMLTADPEITTAVIWQQLADEHGVTVAYPTLRAYVTGHRPRKPSRRVLPLFRTPDPDLT